MDNNINLELNLLKMKLEEFYEKLLLINDDNFENIFVNLKESKLNIDKVKENLTKKYKKEELKNFNIFFEEIIKKISKEFDNKLKILKDKQVEVAEELKSSINKKKISTYR